MAIILRLVQRFQHSKKEEFIALEKEFAQLEHRGILPPGERLMPISGREPGNTIVWQRRFESLAEAEVALKLFETNPEHTELANKQKHFFEGAWVEFYEIVDW
ncbi:MAG: hypothetical protein WA628_10130 [Terriglobales bacterium]